MVLRSCSPPPSPLVATPFAPASRILLCHLSRSVVISLKKKTAEWWDGFSKDKTYKRFIKTDFTKWCEEEDREYMGDFGAADDMGGMGGGGMDFGELPLRRTAVGKLCAPVLVARAPQLSAAATAARVSHCAFPRRWNGRHGRHGRHGHGRRHGQLWGQRRRSAV